MIRTRTSDTGCDKGTAPADFTRTGTRQFAAVCLCAVFLCAAFAGCRSPAAHISKRSLLRGVDRALSERDAISFAMLVRQDDGTLKAYCRHRRDGSGNLKVFRDDRLTYELVRTFDPTGPSMHLTEQNHLNGDTSDDQVPLEQYYSDDYCGPRLLCKHGGWWSCCVGSVWRSWLGPRSDTRRYLADEIRHGKLSTVTREGRKLVQVVRLRNGFRQQYYFDPKDYFLRHWRSVPSSDPRQTRDRTYVYCDGMTEADCVAALDSNSFRLAESEESEGEAP